jgi:hypothetical protein
MDYFSDVELMAIAMAEHSGWDKLHTAKNCHDTPSGNNPAEESEYYRELAYVALCAYLKVDDLED